jgi:hypothetical protein
MRSLTCTLVLTVLVSVPAAADDSYKFHMSIGTVADGLRAVNPAPPALSKTDDPSLQEPAIVFQRIGGDHGWRATFQNCAKKPLHECEFRLNSQSQAGFARDSDPASAPNAFDIGFSPNDDGTVRTRCLRSSCRLRFGKTGGVQSDTTLSFGQSKNVPLDVDIEASFVPR